MQVKDVMSRDVRIVGPEASVQEAAALMREMDCGFLPVGENDRLIGTVTDRDIAVRAVADGRDPTSFPVREAMSSRIAYCFEDQDTCEAADIMCSKQIRRLPVLNRSKRLVGVVSLADLAERSHELPMAGTVLEKVCQPTGQARAM